MNVFELFAKLGLDSSSYESGLDRAEGLAERVGGSIRKGLGVAAAATGAAFSAATAGVVALTTQAVNAYADYEQLTGGIETLYGESAQTMMRYASEAASATGQSMNEYMDAAIQTSAAMISAVEGDQARAAELTNMSMIDMADNANKLGTSMEAIQNAYRGFSRGNFTMLDNLALGYAGTAQGMQQLLADAQAISGVEYDISSYADIVEAIHVVQEEMGIAGTTAEEASETISGSLGALSASWQNLVTGLADPNADIGALISDTVEKAKTALGNLAPAVTQALGGIAELIQAAAPIVIAELPGLIDTILPPLISTAITLVQAVVDNLPSILTAIVDALPDLIDALFSDELISAGIALLSTLGGALIDNAPTIASSILEVLQSLVDSFEQAVNGGGMTGFLDVAIEIIKMLGEFLIQNAPTLISTATDLIVSLIEYLTAPDNMSMMISLGLDIILAIANGLVEAIPDLVSVIPEVMANLILTMEEEYPNVLDAVLSLLGDLGLALLEGLAALMGTSLEDVAGGLANIGTEITNAFENVKQWFQDLWDNLTEKVSGLWEDVTGFFSDGLEDAKETVDSVLGTISETFSSIFDTVKETVSGAIDYVKGLFDFEWSLPDLKLPHFSITGSLDLMANPPSVPKLSVDWYAKAMNQPYMLDEAAIFGMSNGRLLGGGEKGDEMIYGRSSLMQDIKEAVSGASAQTIIIPVYIGDEKIDELVVKSNQRNNYISGGR